MMAAVSPENERNAESAWRLPPSFPLFLIGFVMEGFPPNDVTLLHAVKKRQDVYITPKMHVRLQVHMSAPANPHPTVIVRD